MIYSIQTDAWIQACAYIVLILCTFLGFVRAVLVGGALKTMVCSWSYQPTPQIASNNSTSAPTKLPRLVKGQVEVLVRWRSF